MNLGSQELFVLVSHTGYMLYDSDTYVLENTKGRVQEQSMKYAWSANDYRFMQRWLGIDAR